MDIDDKVINAFPEPDPVIQQLKFYTQAAPDNYVLQYTEKIHQFPITNSEVN